MSKTNKKKNTSGPVAQIKTESPVTSPARANFVEKYELKWLIPIAAVCLFVFANSLSGEFVYDDTRQILRNTLIQDNSLIWKALTSDVWAFKGDGTAAASNYWRPAFTLWHILNFRLFGANPFGWHVMNLVLHSGVCILSYILMRRWKIAPMIACAIALIFAVHPVHVESVAWISGSPDLLFALAFLGSLWFAQNYADKNKTNDLIFSVLLYAVALGAKEIGILCLPVFYLIFANKKDENKKAVSLNSALLFYLAAAIVYFVARIAVLGTFMRPAEDAADPVSAILSVPSIFVFYLRQMFFPYWLSANYPVQPVSQPGLANFILPLLISFAALAAFYLLVRKSKLGMLAAALFILPLLPAMNAMTFIPDQIVHDRYLYLPLLGALMLIIPFAARFLNERNTLIASAALCVVLSFQTFTYNTAWANELALWSWAAKIDNSAFTMAQYGSELSDNHRLDESINAYTAALNVKPAARSYLGRGRSYLKKKQYAEAEKDLNTVLQMPQEKVEAYALYQTYEALGITYSEQGKLDEAIQMFSDARKRLPIYGASLTANMAVVLYQKGQKDEALKELEGAQAQAKRELLPESKTVFMRLGMLYTELGRKDEAKKALQEFLHSTASFNDKIILQERAQADKALKSLN
jgi:tetratricopeptide (TPR) repeat protein